MKKKAAGGAPLERGVRRHTPGPWYMQGEKVWGNMVLDEATNTLLATRKVADFALHRSSKHGQFHDWGGGWDEMEANAKLVSFAPEMLSALRKIASGHDADSVSTARELLARIDDA